MKRHAPRRQHGAALLTALIIVTLVVTLAASMVWQQWRAVQVEAAERARMQSAWILNGALDWARLILREDARSGRPTALTEPWATPLAEARLSTFLAADKDNNADGGPEAFISGSIADAQARFNLRGLLGDDGKVLPLQQLALERLCGLAGVPTDTAQRIVNGLVAAMAPEPESTSEGAGPPLRPSRLADLGWVGIEPRTLERLQPFVDLLPVPTPVNLNTAPREVLVAAIDAIDPGSAERLVQARQRKPFRTLDEARAQLPQGTVLEPNRVSVVSSYFEVSGRLRLEDRVLEETSLLVRRDNRVDVLRRERQSFTTAGR